MPVQLAIFMSSEKKQEEGALLGLLSLIWFKSEQIRLNSYACRRTVNTVEGCFFLFRNRVNYFRE